MKATDRELDNLIEDSLDFKVSVPSLLKCKTLEKIKDYKFRRRLILSFSIFSVLSIILLVIATMYLKNQVIKIFILIFELQLLLTIPTINIIYRKYERGDINGIS